MDRFMHIPHPTRWRVLMTLFFLVHIIGGIFIGPLVVGAFAIVEAALASWVFIIMYFPTRWTETSVGVQLMGMAWLFALLTSVSLIPESLGFDGALREWVALVIITLMPVLMINMIRVLRLAQRRRK